MRAGHCVEREARDRGVAISARLSGRHREISRAGLAPLELILCLPILLTILALIIDLGIEVKWKIRSLAVSRQAVWRQRPGRRGNLDPRPAGWPTKGATFSVVPAIAPPLFDDDPFSQYAVARGPTLRDPNTASAGSQLLVDTDLFDISGKVEKGIATIDRGFPLLPKFPGVHLNVEHLLADGQWQTQEMGIPPDEPGGRGPHDEWRRTRRIYMFIAPGYVQEIAEVYRLAAIAIRAFPLRKELAVLDRDDEFIAWYGAPLDFHPALRPVNICPDDLHCGCTLDRFKVYSGVLKNLIDRIQGPRRGGMYGVPWVMADEFIRMYTEQIGQLAAQTPPDQPRIDALEKLIQQLQVFKGTLN